MWASFPNEKAAFVLMAAGEFSSTELFLEGSFHHAG
jgi:hypothetical protein